MKNLRLLFLPFASAVLMSTPLNAQNVFDNIIAPSPNHTYLEAALIQEGLDVALQNPSATLTVFAPDDQAFLDLATALNTDINGLLALPNLSDILLYHVLGVTVPSSAATNGLIVQPLSASNTLKITLTSLGEVYVNQAQVTTADLVAANGVVHVLNKVLLPSTTVADVAINSPAHSTLVAAVIEARLLPALTDPLASLTLFAPTNTAIDSALSSLGISATDLLSSPALSDILLYHVLGSEVLSTSLSNGMLANTLNPANTLKVTIDGSNVFVNQAQVVGADLPADNGVVHVLDAVVLPNITVADIALGSPIHTTLVSAVVEARLLPLLTDPFSEFTVFAPTNTAFDNLASALGVTLTDILALPNLADILAYHVVSGTVLSTDLVAGQVPTLSGENVIISLTGGVKVNDANVIVADLAADNGVVHVLDKVILSSFLGIEESMSAKLSVYPNPFNDMISISGAENGTFTVMDNSGKVVMNGKVNGTETINTSSLSSGMYTVSVSGSNSSEKIQIVKL
jgi:uncharacterized surface protein with fasciclin (FAS1) repeats